MSSAIIWNGQAPGAANMTADASKIWTECRGKVWRVSDRAQNLYATRRHFTKMNLARVTVIRCEQQVRRRLTGQEKPLTNFRLRETRFLGEGPISAQLYSQFLLKRTRTERSLVGAVAVTNLADASASASPALDQLNESLEKVANSASIPRNLETLQEGFKMLSQSMATVIENATEVSSTAASSIQGQLSGYAATNVSTLKSLESLQQGFGRLSQAVASVAQKGSEYSITALSYLPTDSKILQSQVDQISSNLNYNSSLKTLQQSLGSLSESIASVVERASSASNIAPLNAPTFPSNLLNSNSIGHTSSLQHLGQSASTVLTNAGILISEVGFQISHLPIGGIHLVEHAISQIGTTVGGYSSGLGMDVSPMATSALLATIATSTVVVSSFNYADNRKGFVEGQDLPLRYNADTIGAYFKRRPVDIFLRSARILFSCSNLTVNILFDKYVGREEELQKLRATQLLELIARLGPTAIKIGQALSIRPDILPVVYLEELQKLQDRVPPFSTEEAKRLILEGLGKPAEDIFSELSSEPVAAASLGQVYKARLRDTGDVVAVKVQRPGVLEGISRDLFLLRQGARAFQSLPSVQSDLVALIDMWAIRFFDELDYVQEAKNSIRFSEDMRLLPNVTVPGVFLNYTSRKVLTSAWVDGEKLSETKAADLLPLITIALNCYLMQLLESGFLHADPHPGNLLRTPDGRLCVLDFGLMTEVTEDQRYTLIEYISHLVNSDYARVAEDLVRLGFVPPEFVDPEKTAAVVPQLSRVLGQLVQGGGARKVNIQQVTDDLANISKDYVFVIPPYFALILRAFSVLEGIGLDADPDYTIVDECYPYISKRLLTDDSPRTRAALQYFLYGGKSQLDPVRVEEITSGFQNFRELMVPATGGEGPPPKLKPIDPATKEALLLLFSPEGSFVQDLLLTELVRAVDALSRQALAELWGSFATSLRIPLPSALLIPGSWPLPLPGLVLGLSPTAKVTDEDLQSLETVRRIWTLVEPQFQQRSSLSATFEVAQDVLPFLRDLLPGITSSAQKFLVMLLQRQALRLADDLDSASTRMERPTRMEDSVGQTSTNVFPVPRDSEERLLIEGGTKQVKVLQLEGVR